LTPDSTLNSSVYSLFILILALVLELTKSVLLNVLEIYVVLKILLFYLYIHSQKPMYSQQIYYADLYYVHITFQKFV